MNGIRGRPKFKFCLEAPSVSVGYTPQADQSTALKPTRRNLLKSAQRVGEMHGAGLAVVYKATQQREQT